MAFSFDYIADKIGEGYNNIVDAITDFVDTHKSQPGDPGYWNPSSFFDWNYLTSVIPAFSEVQASTDNARYWSDYVKNTHKAPLYPGMAYHSPSLGRTAESVLGVMDWWK